MGQGREDKMKFTNHLGLPEPVFRALSTDNYQKRAGYSVTELLKPVQQWRLEQDHQDDIEVDVVDRLWSTYGKMTHQIIDNYAEDGNSEVFMYLELGQGLSVGGTADRVDFVGQNRLKISDYKVTSAWSLVFNPEGRDEWEQQLNLYALLAESHYQTEVSELSIVAILRDWSKTEAKRNDTYPKAPIVELKIPLWTPELRGEFLDDRLDAFEAARECDEPEDLPKCSAEERWEKPTTWAVKKDGRKTAVRVFDSLLDLEKYASKESLLIKEASGLNLPTMKKPYYVEVRPGSSIRCAEYCDVAPWCEQYRAMKEEGRS
jgi:hypothetical protein